MTPDIFVSVLDSHNEARTAAREFLDTIDLSKLSNVTKMTNHDIRITLKDGTEYHFMDADTYRCWCLGNSYKMLGDPDTIYLSDHKQTDLNS